MKKPDTAADRKARCDEFMAKHARCFPGAKEDKPLGLLGTTKVTMAPWIVYLLRVAKRENCPEAHDLLVEFFLDTAGLEPPYRVPGTPGRPHSPETDMTYRIWEGMGRPPKSWRKLAHAVYRNKFEHADAAARKRMADRVEQRVKRESRKQPGHKSD